MASLPQGEAGLEVEIYVPFAALDGQVGALAELPVEGWVGEWFWRGHRRPPPTVLRSNFYHFQNGGGSGFEEAATAHLCSGWSKTDCDGDGCNEQHIPYSFGVLVLVGA